MPGTASTLVAAVTLFPAAARSQTTAAGPAGQASTAAAATASPDADADDEEIITLTPFEVVADDSSDGYVTAKTLAGNRLATDLRDLGTSLSIYNSQFMSDVGATDQRTLLQYTLGTEVGGILGNYSGSGGGISPDSSASFSNPQSTNRVRGLVGADNTRDLYLTNIPWDGYNIDAVDIQRGPNAILFGQGSPAGVINTRTKQAGARNSGEVGVRFDQYGSLRSSLDINKVIVRDELSIRLAGVVSQAEFQQKEAFEDFNRQWVALRYEPSFLKKGSARTIIKADAEIGTSTSNRPRNMPPEDFITPWFSIGTPTYNLAWLNEANWQIPGRGDATRQDYATPANPNPNFQPLLGGRGAGYAGYFGGSVFQFDRDSSTALMAMALNPVTYLGIGANGERDGTIGGLAPSGPRGMPGYREYAAETNLPFSSLAKNKYVTDTSIFNYFDHMIDGSIKREWYDFTTYDASLSQTFFKDTVGIDIAYHDESYKSGGYNPVGNAIHIDVHSRWIDGTNTPENGWYLDGTPNVGAGRPYVTVGNSEGRSRTDRETLRSTAFATYDFAKSNDSAWLLRLLGQHTVTGMVSRDDYYRTGDSWVKSTFTGDYYNNAQFQEIKDNNGRFWADFVPQRRVYIGPSLVGKSLGDNFGLLGPAKNPQIGSTATLRYFDSHWNAPTVDPAAVWYNQATVGLPSGAFASTQSENPANYVGWVTRDVTLMTDDDPRNIPALTDSRTWDSRYNKAWAVVWQGKFWNDSIVATAGRRHDEVYQKQTQWNRDISTDDVTQIPFRVSSLGPVKADSNSWGLVAHFDQLPFIDRWMQRLPITISATYNKSENFQTGQVFSDYWGQDLPLPKGETEDMGVILTTRNGKYSLRVNKFESAVKNNPSSGLQFWNYGNNLGIYAQAYHQIKYNYVNRSQPNSTRYGDNIISDLPVPGENDPQTKWNFDYRPLNGQTLEQAQAQEIAVITAWDQWLTEMAPLPQLMGKAWSFAWDGTDFTEAGLSSFRFTEDLLAEGYEFEFHAQVTDSWRLTVNASRIKSYRDNIGNTPAPGGQMSMIDYLLDFDRRLNETAMGDLRIWGPGGTANARENWNGYANGDLKARLAEQGTVVPENRLWHINLVSNYNFREGKLRGWNVGAAARYQSAMTLAYTPVQGPNYIGYDLTRPYRDKSLVDFDAWVGYERKLFSDRIDWRAQLNISNIGVGDELLPVTVQPDGTPAAYRIRPAQYIFLSNTFSF